MPRKSRDEAEKTRARILSNALGLFVRNGYERTTFTDIAAKLRMTKGAVYWHFATKEALLEALVDEMMTRFADDISSQIPADALDFAKISAFMVRTGVRVADDPKGRAYFLFLKTQVKWRDESMRQIRDRLIAGTTCGPFVAFRQAVVNGHASGKVRDGVDPEEVASICMAVWDGLIQSRIDGFLQCDLETALRRAYEAVWVSIEKR